MSQSQQINRPDSVDVAPTPQNTPLDTQVLANRPANLGKPQVEDIGEGEEEDDQEDVSGANPASLLAKVGIVLIYASGLSGHHLVADTPCMTSPVFEEFEGTGKFKSRTRLTYQNPALLALAQSKFDQLIGQSSGYIESLPPAVRRRIDGLKGVQVEHAKIESEFQMAILMLEKKVS